MDADEKCFRRDVKESDWNRREIPSEGFSRAVWVSKHDILSCLNKKIKPKERSIESLNLEEAETKEANYY